MRFFTMVLLFVLLAVPVSAQTEDTRDSRKGIAYAIQSFGWKCNEVQNYEGGFVTSGRYIGKITCERNRTYYLRNINAGKHGLFFATLCTSKGECKEFK